MGTGRSLSSGRPRAGPEGRCGRVNGGSDELADHDTGASKDAGTRRCRAAAGYSPVRRVPGRGAAGWTRRPPGGTAAASYIAATGARFRGFAGAEPRARSGCHPKERVCAGLAVPAEAVWSDRQDRRRRAEGSGVELVSGLTCGRSGRECEPDDRSAFQWLDGSRHKPSRRSPRPAPAGETAWGPSRAVNGSARQG